MSKKIEYYFSPGNTLEDPDTNLKFTIQKFLGKGAFAQCFSAHVNFEKINFNSINKTNKNLKYLENIKNVCLKIVQRKEINSDRLREKLSSEICIQKSLNHKNIVKLFHTFSNSIYIIMIMELCDSTLSDILKQNKKFRESHTKKFVIQLLNAIEYLHSVNVVHRDIKLSNILLSDYSIKLADFGLCALIQKNKRTTVCGTPNYIAPEIIAKTAYSFECDIWSIGVLIYTMLVGTPPFHKKTAKEIYFSIKKNEWKIPESCVISNEAKDLLDKLLVREPSGRLSISEIFNHPFFTKKDSLVNVVLENIKNNYLITNNDSRNKNYDTVVFCIYLTKINGLGYKMLSNRFGIYFLNGDSIIKKDKNSFVFITSSIENNKKVLRKEDHEIFGSESFTGLKRGKIFLEYFEKLNYLIDRFSDHKPINNNLNFTFVVRVRRVSGNLNKEIKNTNNSAHGSGYLLGLWNNSLVFSFGSAIITVFDGKFVECIECEYENVKDLMIKALE